MIMLNRIYTRTGDRGDTALGNGKRVAKTSPRIEAIGAVDEANAAIGIVRLSVPANIDAMLARIQNDLFDLGADLCVPPDGARAEGALRIAPEQVARLETEIDALNAGLAPLTSFVLPGGVAAAAHLHLARTVVRRAERAVVALTREETVGEAALAYINRLSDHLFVAARHCNRKGPGDMLWRPGANR